MINNFDNYLFRCSSLPKLMPGPRAKAGELQVTQKTALDEIFIEAVFGRRNYITNEAMIKGIVMESQALSLYSEVTGQTLFKNKKELSNEFIKGTPDVITDEIIIDIKNAWDIWTFDKKTAKEAQSEYFDQLVGYCFLSKKTKAQIAYCLVNTVNDDEANPLNHIVEKKINYSASDIYLSDSSGKFSCIADVEEQLKLHFQFDDIDPKFRLKTFDFEVTNDDFEKIKSQVFMWRNYLNNRLEEIKN